MRHDEPRIGDSGVSVCELCSCFLTIKKRVKVGKQNEKKLQENPEKSITA